MINPRLLVSSWSVNGHKAPLKPAELTVTSSGPLIQVTLICKMPNGGSTRMRIQMDAKSALELAESISPSPRTKPIEVFRRR